MIENEIKKLSKYIQVPIGKLSYTEDNIIQMKTTGDEKIVGFSTIINFLHNNKVDKENQNSEDFFLAKQFFDFANLYIRSTSKRDKFAACLELNSYLETRSYLVGQRLSLADLVVFYAISDIMRQLSPHEKDQYLNLSRWFDHLQQQDAIRQGGSPVNFSTVNILSSTTRV